MFGGSGVILETSSALFFEEMRKLAGAFLRVEAFVCEPSLAS